MRVFHGKLIKKVAEIVAIAEVYEIDDLTMLGRQPGQRLALEAERRRARV
jgi:hypothetical protein